MTVLLDDHLLRDWMVGADGELRRAVGREPVATTNLWYARLCKSAARSTGGALVGDLGPGERQAVVAALVRLPDSIAVLPMRDLARRMGALVAAHKGPLHPRVRGCQCCERLAIRYSTVMR